MQVHRHQGLNQWSSVNGLTKYCQRCGGVRSMMPSSTPLLQNSTGQLSNASIWICWCWWGLTLTTANLQRKLLCRWCSWCLKYHVLCQNYQLGLWLLRSWWPNIPTLAAPKVFLTSYQPLARVSWSASDLPSFKCRLHLAAEMGVRFMTLGELWCTTLPRAIH